MKTLVTGGCGFIGSHLTDALLAAGHEVVVLDNFSTGRPQNLKHVQDHPALQVVQVDISEYGAIDAYFEGVERVFHLAALADIVPSIQQPIGYHRANVDGTINVLEACRKMGVKRLVYAASSSCYGIPAVYPTPETAPINPEYPYATTKWIGEQYVLNWHKVYGLPVTSLRFFNVYGPRSRTSGTYGAVFGVFLAQKLNNSPFTVVGDGTQTRDFTFVTDVAHACMAAADHEAAIGQVLNVGSGGTYSVNQLVSLLGGEVTYIPKRPGEPDCTFADTTRIRSLIGWEPQVSFEDGVRIMLEHIDYWREAPLWTPDRIADATQDWFKYLGRNK
ncbi:MAG: SDR family oxidoreductase [Bacteroidia bacterium]|nr:SDR family oxidoreductase [Bacteroidia bacterium]